VLGLLLKHKGKEGTPIGKDSFKNLNKGFKKNSKNGRFGSQTLRLIVGTPSQGIKPIWKGLPPKVCLELEGLKEGPNNWFKLPKGGKI